MKGTVFALLVALAPLSAASTSAQTGTWTGTISDSSCGVSHDAMTEHGRKASAKQCTEMCVLKGAQYVFVDNGKVLMIKNQDLAELKTHAGDRVTITGHRAGDTITITRIAAAR